MSDLEKFKKRRNQGSTQELQALAHIVAAASDIHRLKEERVTLQPKLSLDEVLADFSDIKIAGIGFNRDDIVGDREPESAKQTKPFEIKKKSASGQGIELNGQSDNLYDQIKWQSKRLSLIHI